MKNRVSEAKSMELKTSIQIPYCHGFNFLHAMSRKIYKNYEIIAVNECSTDAMGEILHRLAAINSGKEIIIINLSKPLPVAYSLRGSYTGCS
jgi:hypothetical protein